MIVGCYCVGLHCLRVTSSVYVAYYRLKVSRPTLTSRACDGVLAGRCIIAGGGIGNAVISGSKGPLVKMAVFRGNASGKYVASFGNRCRLSLSGQSTIVIVSCIKCGARRLGKSRLIRGVILRRSTITLSRLIIIKCTIRGGGRLANSASSLGTDSGGLSMAADLSRVVRNGLDNMGVAGTSNVPNKTIHIDVHNMKSVGNSGRPLFIVSNVPMDGSSGSNIGKHFNNDIRGPLSVLGPGSVRSVSMLGSTTTATVCNSETAGNIIVIAAGEKGGNRQAAMGLDTSCNLRSLPGRVRVTSSSLCLAIHGRTIGGCGARGGLGPKSGLCGALRIGPHPKRPSAS